MLKNLTRLEHKIGDKVYHMYCDMDSPLHEVKDALCTWMGHVAQIEAAAKAAAQPEVKEPEVVEEPPKG